MYCLVHTSHTHPTPPPPPTAHHPPARCSCPPGFAEGLSRPATLLVGDLSFLHDINGLNLLRGGELRPPLTVVLVNNSGECGRGRGGGSGGLERW